MSSAPEDCIFCKKINCKVLEETKYFFVIRDTAYPVTEHHTLIISNRHVSNFFELNDEENKELSLILKNQKEDLQNLDKTITGFNVGVNIGKDAGQSIMHCHIHLIPRREGDVENPQGGVRSVIPKKQHYKRK